MNIENKIFKEYLKKISLLQNTEEKQKLVDEFIAQLNSDNYPIYESETEVVLLYKSVAPTIQIIGDMTNWAERNNLNRIEGTDLHFIRLHLEADACLEYWFMKEGDENPIVDPLNPFILYHGLGNLSELAMPGYKRHPILAEFTHGKKGTAEGLLKLELPPGKLSYPHTVHVYLPPGYEESMESYPVIYFQDGLDYIEFAVAPHILNTLISSGKINPVIAVFVTPPNRHQPAEPNRMTEYGLNDDYLDFFADELVTFIDSHFRTKKIAESRLVVGDSYGGLISTYIAFKHPEIFGLAYSQSGYQSFNNSRMIDLFKSSENKPVKYLIECGTYELEVGSTFLPEGERDFTKANRELNKVLIDKGYKHFYNEYHEGHTWGNWRRHLIDALIYFFGNGNLSGGKN